MVFTPSLRIDLKCGEYLDFYNLKRVEILADHDMITFVGNTEKGKRNVTHQAWLKTIKNIKELNRFIRKEMKFFQCDGICPHCDSLNVLEQGRSIYFKKLNEPKEKRKYEEHTISGYRCKGCGKAFSELKRIDLVIYYK